MKRDKHV